MGFTESGIMRLDGNTDNTNAEEDRNTDYTDAADENGFSIATHGTSINQF